MSNKSVTSSYMYCISGIFRVGLILAEFAISLKSPKIGTVKNKPYYTSSMRVLEIATIGLSENLTYPTICIFAKISRCEKFSIYGMSKSMYVSDSLHVNMDEGQVQHFHIYLCGYEKGISYGIFCIVICIYALMFIAFFLFESYPMYSICSLYLYQYIRAGPSKKGAYSFMT